MRNKSRFLRAAQKEISKREAKEMKSETYKIKYISRFYLFEIRPVLLHILGRNMSCDGFKSMTAVACPRMNDVTCTGRHIGKHLTYETSP